MFTAIAFIFRASLVMFTAVALGVAFGQAVIEHNTSHAIRWAVYGGATAVVLLVVYIRRARAHRA